MAFALFRWESHALPTEEEEGIESAQEAMVVAWDLSGATYDTNGGKRDTVPLTTWLGALLRRYNEGNPYTLDDLDPKQSGEWGLGSFVLHELCLKVILTIDGNQTYLTLEAPP